MTPLCSGKPSAGTSDTSANASASRKQRNVLSADPVEICGLKVISEFTN